MAGKLSKFQMVGFDHWFGTTSDNNLAKVYQTSRQKASNYMVQLLAFQRGKTLDTFLSQFKVQEFENDEEYYWEVIGSSRRNIPLVEARDEDGNLVTSGTSGNVGTNHTKFYVTFNEYCFAHGEVIVGNLNQIYPMRIIDHGVTSGTMTTYKVELINGDTKGIPPERLLAGERFSVDYAVVEKEMSRKVGDIGFTTPVAMSNEWSVIRLQHKVAGNKLDKKLAMGVPVVKRNAEGKLVKSVEPYWMHYVEWEMDMKFSDYKNNVMAFGVSNRNRNGEYMNFGDSGNVIKTGAGLFEQMEVANTFYYNNFNLKVLEDAIYELCRSKLGFNERKFILKTGELGAAQFSKAVANEVSGWKQYVIDNSSTGVVRKTTSKLHSNALAAGYQYTEYEAPNHVILQVDVDPFYDDDVRNKIMHPNGGVAMSYRYDIMFMGTEETPNITKCKIKGKNEIRSFQAGLRNPFTGEENIQYGSYDEDSAVEHRMATLGICVYDPTRTISIIPAILAG